MISLTCNACGKRLKAPTDLVGRLVKCKCGHSFVVTQAIPNSTESFVPERAIEDPWIGDSSKTIKVWCGKKASVTSDVRMFGTGYGRTECTYSAHDYTVKFPSRVGVEVVKVVCPICGDTIDVQVAVDDKDVRVFGAALRTALFVAVSSFISVLALFSASQFIFGSLMVIVLLCGPVAGFYGSRPVFRYFMRRGRTGNVVNLLSDCSAEGIHREMEKKDHVLTAD